MDLELTFNLGISKHPMFAFEISKSSLIYINSNGKIYAW